MPRFSKRSKQALETCHEDLQKLMNEAIKYYDFSVLCGYRGEEAQNKAFEQGYSKVKFPNGRHNERPSTAVDCAPYPIKWNREFRWRFAFMAGVITTVAKQLDIEIEWGGDWQKWKDRPHFQLKLKENK
ncbi:MAG: M15 family metallopeptidase [bacterium]|nr:M15 family metallopeptidase [bacterium]